MNNTATKIRRVGAAADVIDAQLAGGRVALSLPELVGKTGLTAPAANRQLLRLGRRVARVSHRFFVIVSPEHYAMGGPPVEQWLDDYFTWLGHPYYLALQSAAASYGASPQAIQVTQVITDAPRRPVEVGRLRICFFVKRAVEKTMTQQLARAFAPLRVSTPAATAFDLVRYAPRIGGIERAVETLVPLLPMIEARDALAVLEAENETATAQRLGYVVEKAGRTDLASVIDKWLPSRCPITPLIPTKAVGKSARLVQRWRVLDNSLAFSL
jgi:hypothetical protein